MDPPGKSWTPLENVGPPLEPLKMVDFFEIDHLTSVKKLRTKKQQKTMLSELCFCQNDLDPLTNITGSAHGGDWSEVFIYRVSKKRGPFFQIAIIPV